MWMATSTFHPLPQASLPSMPSDEGRGGAKERMGIEVKEGEASHPQPTGILAGARPCQ